MHFTIEKNIQLHLLEARLKFHSMEYNRIVSKLLAINQSYVVRLGFKYLTRSGTRVI